MDSLFGGSCSDPVRFASYLFWKAPAGEPTNQDRHLSANGSWGVVSADNSIT